MTQNIFLQVDFYDGDSLVSAETFKGQALVVSEQIATRLKGLKSHNPGISFKTKRATWDGTLFESATKLSNIDRIIGVMVAPYLIETLSNTEAPADPMSISEAEKPKKELEFKIGFRDSKELKATKTFTVGSIDDLGKLLIRYLKIAENKFPDSENMTFEVLKMIKPNGKVVEGKKLELLTDTLLTLVHPTFSPDAPEPEEPKEEPAPEADTEEKPKAEKPEKSEKNENPEAKEKLEDKEKSDKPKAKAKPDGDKDEEDEVDEAAEDPAPGPYDGIHHQIADSMKVIRKEEKHIHNALITTLKTEPSQPLADWWNDTAKPAFAKLSSVLEVKILLIKEAATSQIFEVAEDEPKGSPHDDLHKQVAASLKVIRKEEDKIHDVVTQAIGNTLSKPLGNWWKEAKKAFTDLFDAVQTQLFLIKDEKKETVQEAAPAPAPPIDLKKPDAAGLPNDMWDVAIAFGFSPQHAGREDYAKLTKDRMEIWLKYSSPIDVLYSNFEIKDGGRRIAAGTTTEELLKKLQSMVNPTATVVRPNDRLVPTSPTGNIAEAEIDPSSVTTKVVPSRDQDGQDRYMILIKHNGGICGEIELIDKGDHMKIDHSHIDPQYRYQGYGRALYQAAIDLTRKYHKKWLMSGYSISNDARALWKRIGGTEFHEVPGASSRFKIEV